MSNVRDERLFRTFRDNKVKFFQPGQQKSDWFNIMSVHQNHVAHTETSYLPEHFLPDFLDLVVWGHEHECLIDPTYNPETNFHVMQPGSSVATSLMPGEAVPKHVAVVSVTGKDFKVEPIRLKTVRPFLIKDITLSEEKEAMKLVKKNNNGPALTRFLEGVVEGMIKEAMKEWEEAQGDEERDEDDKPPLPLIRLRVEYSAPEGGNFECENPQRFSSRFVGKVANTTDVVSFHRRKSGVRKTNQKNQADQPEEAVMHMLEIDSVQIEKMVREYLAAQTLTLLPQNAFGKAVSEYVDKDDKHAMESFLMENLAKQVEYVMELENVDEENVQDAIEEGRSKLEELFAAGHTITNFKRKPQPADWDEDMNGPWVDDPRAVYRSDEGENADSDATPAPDKPAAKGRGRAAAPKKAAPATKAAPAKSWRGKKKVVSESEEDEDEDDDVVMANVKDDDEEDVEDSQSQLFVKQTPPPTTRGRKPAAAKKTTSAAPAKKTTMAAPAKRAPARAAASQSAKQSQLNFSQPPASSTKVQPKMKVEEIEEISDDDEAFEPAPSARSARSKR